MNEIRFDDQVVLITGAGRGLGAAYARAFAERGAQVVVHDAGVELDGSGGDRALADAVAREIGGEACHENLSDPAACARTIEFALDRLGRLDVVVHNAGLLVLEELTQDPVHWEAVRSVGVDAPFHLTRAALPAMKDQGYGRFVFTTSGRAMRLESAVPGLAAYNAAKMASFGLMLATAVEGEPYGIRANAISPVAATRMLQREVEPGELDPGLVAPGVLFLASDRCDFSGVVLSAAGGRFSVAGWHRGPEIDLGGSPTEPDTIAERWHEIEGAVYSR